MLISSVRDNENNRWQRKTKNKDTKELRDDACYIESVRAKWFCWAFDLCKASLIFKSNLELALSIILKERELYEPKHVLLECRCLKIWDLLSFLIYSSIVVLKWRQVSPM